MRKYRTSIIWAVVCVVSLLSSTFRFMPEIWAMLATLVGVVSAAGLLVVFFAARGRDAEPDHSKPGRS